MQMSRDSAAHVLRLMLVAVTLAGCAGTPHVDPPAGAAASTPPSAQAAASVSQRAVPEAVNVATDAAVLTAKARPGYRLRNRNGTPVWCRKETPTGSRMPVETCYTATQLEQIEAEAEDVKDTLGKQRAICGADCAGD
jgi:hypothetical protein